MPHGLGGFLTDPAWFIQQPIQRYAAPTTMRRMDMVRFGRGIRALRLRRRWRQQDVAAAAGVSRSVIARVEVGLGDKLPVQKLDKVANALGARTDLRLSWNGEALDRLLDAAHAELVEAVAARLRRAGWEIAAEVTFWIRGERGSVDLLAWHAATRLVLVVEVKSVVPDIQAMFACSTARCASPSRSPANGAGRQSGSASSSLSGTAARLAGVWRKPR